MTTFIFGEAMLEYHSAGGTGLRYGGDTLNTAIHLARAGYEVAYVTALGTDPISDAMIADWAARGIDTRFVLRHPDRTPGIYAIHLDDKGERSFLYWRDRSAARAMFALAAMDDALAAAERSSLVYFSLITLAVIDREGVRRLLEMAARRRDQGLAVAYDSNFRPALWHSLSAAREVSMRAMKTCSVGLPTNTDERELWDTAEDETAIARRWAERNRIVAVKAGDAGCLLMEDQGGTAEWLHAQPAKVVDTSGAGDAFNAGFLAAHLSGNDPRACAEAGQALARSTIGHLGAVPPA